MKGPSDVRLRGELSRGADSVSGGARDALEPVRLLEGGASPFERRLLESARVDHLPRVSREQLACSLQVPGGHGLARRLRELLGTSRFARYGTLVGLGALALLGGWAARVGAQRSSVAEGVPSVAVETPASTPTQLDPSLRDGSSDGVREPAAGVTASDETAVGAAAAREPGDSAPPRRGAKARPRPRAATTTSEVKAATAPSRNGLGEELHALEAAQALLRTGRSSDAQRALADYAHRFPAGELALEAQLLNVDVLVARGERKGALERARQLLARPEAARYRGRLDALMGAAQKDGTPAESGSALAPRGRTEATQ